MSVILGSIMMISGAAWWGSLAFDIEWSVGKFLSPAIFWAGFCIALGGLMP